MIDTAPVGCCMEGRDACSMEAFGIGHLVDGEANRNGVRGVSSSLHLAKKRARVSG